MQMAAVAGVIHYYGWKSVIALFTDDDFGNNAIHALRYALEQFGTTIVYTAALNPSIDRKGFDSMLMGLKQMKTRVFVVHMQPDLGLTLLSVAIRLRMLRTSYVWIVTDGISNMLDTVPLTVNSLEILQGIIGTRRYIPKSPKLKHVQSELKNRMGDTFPGDQFISTDAWYAYDSLLMVTKAIHSFMSQQKPGSFVSAGFLPAISGENFDLAKGKVFNDGPMLLHKILDTRFFGVTGFIEFDAKGDRLDSVFEIVNRVGTGLKVVGYWTMKTGCLTTTPHVDSKGAFNATARRKELGLVIWPGGSPKVPKGWIDPKDGKRLRILVPNKVGLRTFVETRVDAHNKTVAFGFCIDVFKAALAYLPYNVSYTITSFGTGGSTPFYDDLVEKVANKLDGTGV
eukprot:Gb_06331 [translate_table: standard]